MIQARLFLLTLGAALVLAGCTTRAESGSVAERGADIPAIKVEVSPVQSRMAPLPVHASGLVAAQEEWTLSFKIGGVVQAVYVQEGQTVKKGQLLAALDPAEINAQVKQVQQAMAKAERDLARVQALYEDTVATLEQVQDLTTALEVARASVEIAEFNQGKSALYAPESGKVLRRFADKGEVVSPGIPVVLLAASGRAQVIRLGLSDVDVISIRPGDLANVYFDVYPGETFPARVTEIAAGADPRSGTYEVELTLQNPPKPLKNGFVGRADIQPSSKNEWIFIPMEAMVEADAHTVSLYVSDAQGEVAELKTIKGYVLRDNMIGLEAAQLTGVDYVITEGGRYLQPGARIDILDTVATTDSPAN